MLRGQIVVACGGVDGVPDVGLFMLVCAVGFLFGSLFGFLFCIVGCGGTSHNRRDEPCGPASHNRRDESCASVSQNVGVSSVVSSVAWNR